MIITRREFCAAVLASTLLGALASLPAIVLPAFAAEPSPEDLTQTGPLPEQAQGSPDAPITLIEYASMTCTHCANFAAKVFPELKARYIDTGKVRYILREFPLDPVSAQAFMLARCAGDKYFAMVDVLFKMQSKWAFAPDPKAGLLAIARQAGISEQTFKQCLTNQKVLDGIEQVHQRAEKLGIESTPTFFINGKIHRGEMSIDEMAKQFEPYLKNG